MPIKKTSQSIVSRIKEGKATPEDIAEAVVWVGWIGLTTPEEHEENKQSLVDHSRAYWIDILIDLLYNTPKEQEQYHHAVVELMGLVLRRHAEQIHKLNPLLYNENYLSDAILALNYMQSEEALPTIEILFERATGLDEQNVINLLDAIQSIGGEKAHEAFALLCTIISERIQTSPRIKTTVDTAFDWEN